MHRRTEEMQTVSDQGHIFAQLMRTQSETVGTEADDHSLVEGTSNGQAQLEIVQLD